MICMRSSDYRRGLKVGRAGIRSRSGISCDAILSKMACYETKMFSDKSISRSDFDYYSGLSDAFREAYSGFLR